MNCTLYVSFCRACSGIDSTLVYNNYFMPCIYAVYHHDHGDAAFRVTSQFATFCQQQTGSSESPMLALCGRFSSDVAFPVIGPDCDVPCVNGYASDDHDDVCECMEGYWGSDCSETCPGGTGSSSCAGFGACSQQTGECTCPPSRTGTDCASCTDGWYGAECSVAVTDVSAASSTRVSVASTGEVHTIDGLNFLFTGVGVYDLLTLAPGLVIQGKFISCYSGQYCLSQVGVRVSGSSYGRITVYGITPPSVFPAVFLNDEQSLLVEPAFFTGTTIERESALEVKISLSTSAGAMTVYVRASGTYLDLSVAMPTSLAATASGVLSGTNSNDIGDKTDHIVNALYADYDCADSVQSPAGSAAGSINVGATPVQYGNELASLSDEQVREYCHTWLTTCDVMHYMNMDVEMQHMGGYALSFDGSALYTLEFESIGSDITVEVFIRTNSSGTIMSYSSDVNFVLYIDDTVKVMFGADEEVWDTQLTVESGEWNKLTMSYEAALGRINVYVFQADGNVHRRENEIETNIFARASTISLGQWQPPTDSQPHTVLPAFVGLMDNFRLWSRCVTPDVISNVFELGAAAESEHILSTWHFDRDVGQAMIRDGQYADHFSMSSLPWNRATWVASNIPQPISVATPALYPQAAELVREVARSRCMELMEERCEGMDATVDFYLDACVRMVAFERHEMAGARLLLLLEDICEIATDSAWQADELCANTAVRQGSDCSDAFTCLFGFEDANNTCQCFGGFQGAVCDNPCLATNGYVCSGHGMCEDDGSCTCDYNWEGAADCSECSTGFSGADCSLLVTNPPSGYKMAAVTASGYYLTFDGHFFAMAGQSGELTLLDGVAEVRTQQHDCASETCVTKLTVTFASVELEVTPSYGRYPTLMADNVEQTISPEVLVVASGLNARLSQDDELEITADDSAGVTLTVKVRQNANSLLVTMVASATACSSNTALLGSCDGNRDNDLAGVTDGMTRMTRAAHLAATHMTGGSNHAASGFAMSFDQTYAVSGLLRYNMTSDFTVSFMHVTSQHGGVILSYAKDGHVFSVDNDEHLTLRCDDETMLLTSANDVDTWHQLIVSYDSDAHEFHTWLFTDSDVTYEIIDSECDPDVSLFAAGGRLALGADALSQGVGGSYESTFVGEVDELSIWNIRFSHDQALQAWKLDVTTQRFAADLAYLYKFDEGHGCDIRDLRSGNDLRATCTLGSNDDWVESSSVISSVITTDGSISTETPSNVYQDGSRGLPDWGVVPTDSVGSAVIPGFGFAGTGVLQGVINNPTHLIDSVPDSIATAVSELTSLIDSAALEELVELSDDVISDISASSSSVDHTLLDALSSIALQVAVGAGDADLAFTGLESALHVSLTDDASNDDIFDQLYTGTCSESANLPLYCSEHLDSCVFGEWDRVYLRCHCQSGYYGDRCDEECPGGVVSPCSNNGVCLSDGTCECEGHFGEDDCSACEENWTGAECNILMLDVLNPVQNVTQLTSSGSVVTSDMLAFDLLDEGTYELLSVNSSSLDTEMQIFTELESCEDGLCVHSILIVIGEDEIYINAHALDSTDHVTLWQSVVEHVDVWTTTNVHGLDVTRNSNTGFTLEISGLISINIEIFGGLTVTTTIESVGDLTTGGLLGSCNTQGAIQMQDCVDHDVCTDGVDLDLACARDLDTSALQEFATSLQAIDDVVDLFETFEEADQALFNHFEEELDEHVTDSENVTNLGVLLQDTGLSTGLLDAALPFPEFTYEMQINPQDHGGVIMAYGPSANEPSTTFPPIESGGDVILTGQPPAVFALENAESGLTVHYDSEEYETGLQLELDSWTQVSLGYSYESNNLDLMVLPSGDDETVSTFSVQLDDDAFQPQGVLTLGQNVEGDSSVQGSLNAVVDEVRVWDYAMMPGDVINAPALDTSPTTPGLFASYSFDQPSLPFVDEVGTSHLAPTSGDLPPLVPASDLNLTPLPGFTSPDLPLPPRPLNLDETFSGGIFISGSGGSFGPTDLMSGLATLEVESEELTSGACEDLFADPNLQSECLDVDASPFLDQCNEQVARSGDADDAVGPLNAYMSLCNGYLEPDVDLRTFFCNTFNVSNLGYVGDTCDQECLFGIWNDDDDVCECDGTHSGSGCVDACPVTSLGVCNGFGVCNEDDGSCTCPRNTFASALNFEVLLNPPEGNNTLAEDEHAVDYGCDVCADGWRGIDCSIAVSDVNAETPAALVMGSFISTFDGASFESHAAGALNVIVTDDITVQTQFAPCVNSVTCRQLTEVAAEVGNTVVSVALVGDGELSVTVTYRGSDEEISFPFNLDSPTRDDIEVDWDTEGVARIVFDDMTLTVATTGNELMLAATLPDDFSSDLTGVFGNNDGDVIDDFNFGLRLPDGTYDDEFYESNDVSTGLSSEIFPNYFIIICCCFRISWTRLSPLSTSPRRLLIISDRTKTTSSC